ncbi:MAG TPA: phosphoenolpyruvate carboxykinase (ATP), partial [Gaiellaceae bacterium]
MTFNPLDVRTPAQGEAKGLAAEFGLENHGLTNLRCVYWNLPPEALYEEISFRGEGRITRDGSIALETGKHTSRSAQDKFIVRNLASEGRVWWGEYNRPIAAEKFDEIYGRLLGYLQGRDLFVQDCVANHDPIIAAQSQHYGYSPGKSPRSV